MNEIQIRPIQFSWSSEWLPKIRASSRRVLSAMKTSEHPTETACRLIGEFERDVDSWLLGLSPEKREDVVRLIKAETYMMHELIDPGHPQIPKPVPDSWEGMEFRERWHEVLPLIRAAVRIEIPGAPSALDELRRLEAFAEGRGFLP